MSTTDCPICQETVKAFVTLECSHKLCLECYHKCIQHSHQKCSLCRTEIPEMTDIVYHIEDLKEEIENLDNELDFFKDLVKKHKEYICDLQQDNDLLEYKNEISGEQSFNMMYQD